MSQCPIDDLRPPNVGGSPGPLGTKLEKIKDRRHKVIMIFIAGLPAIGSNSVHNREAELEASLENVGSDSSVGSFCQQELSAQRRRRRFLGVQRGGSQIMSQPKNRHI